MSQARIRPVTWGLIAALAMLVLFVGWTFAFHWSGHHILMLPTRLGFEVFAIFICAYSFGLFMYLRRYSEADVLALAPAIDLPEPELAQRAATIAAQGKGLVAWCAAWLVVTLIATWFWAEAPPPADSEFSREMSQSVIPLWSYPRNLIYALALSLATWTELSVAARLGRLLTDHGRVNLLDRSALRPLTTRAKRSVLAWIPMVGFSSIGLVVVPATALYLPAAGIKRRYADEKQRQLGTVRARIAERSASVVEGQPGKEDVALPELVTWEQRLEKARVWPWDFSSSMRMLIYTVIGLASWVGAALVEQLLEVFFG